MSRDSSGGEGAIIIHIPKITASEGLQNMVVAYKLPCYCIWISNEYLLGFRRLGWVTYG